MTETDEDESWKPAKKWGRGNVGNRRYKREIWKTESEKCAKIKYKRNECATGQSPSRYLNPEPHESKQECQLLDR
jgi:hypothetical protein